MKEKRGKDFSRIFFFFDETRKIAFCKNGSQMEEEEREEEEGEEEEEKEEEEE